MMRIVAATDLADSGERAVSLASTLAEATGARLEVVHALDLPPEPAPLEVSKEIEPALETFRARVRRRVERAAGELEKVRDACQAHGLECETRVLEGPAWEAVLEEASQTGAHLLVVGPHGLRHRQVWREQLVGRLLGTTADRLVRHAPCPVLVAGGQDDVTDLGGAKWLVGMDFSPASVAALRLARRLAEATGGQLLLAHAVQPSGVGEDGEEDATWQQLLREQSRKEAKQRLEELAATEAAGSEVYQGDRVSHGPPSEELCAAVSELGARFLVVGNHGRHGLGRILLGSTAERCLHRSDVPVLVVRAEDAGRA